LINISLNWTLLDCTFIYTVGPIKNPSSKTHFSEYKWLG
jgi:hypothetical protein